MDLLELVRAFKVLLRRTEESDMGEFAELFYPLIKEYMGLLHMMLFGIQTQLNLEHAEIIELRALFRRITHIVRMHENPNEDRSDYARYGM